MQIAFDRRFQFTTVELGLSLEQISENATRHTALLAKIAAEADPFRVSMLKQHAEHLTGRPAAARRLYLEAQKLTDAGRFAEALGGDGQCFETDDGRDFRTVADGLGARRYEWKTCFGYEFRDASHIIVYDNCWDFGFDECDCMNGAPDDECRAPHRCPATMALVRKAHRRAVRAAKRRVAVAA